MKILMGTCRHSMDGKNRIRIPNKFKAELAAGGESLHFVQFSEGCVAVMNDTVLQQKFGRFDDLDPSNEQLLEAMRFILSRVEDVEEDGQHRVTLSKSVRDAIGLDKDHTELITVGMVNYIEIWRADIREARQEGMTIQQAQTIAKENATATQQQK